jgi:putative transposase
MAKEAVKEERLNIRQACEAFRVSQACYRNQPKLSDENALIAEWLERLTANQRNRGFGFVSTQRQGVRLEPQAGLAHVS